MIFLILLFLFPCVAKSEIVVTDQLDLIHQEISDHAAIGTLILIDIGDTLLFHVNPLAYKAHEPWILDWFKQNASEFPKQSIQTLIFDIRNHDESWMLTDPKWPWLIQFAKEKGAKVAAFSKQVPIPEIRNNRLKRLLTLKLELSKDLSLKESEGYDYQMGVIETTLESKGECLKEILKSQVVSHLIFIDNELPQVASVEKVCLERDLPCKTFYFTLKKMAPLLDPIAADQELRVLIRDK